MNNWNSNSKHLFGRREFMKSAAAAGAGLPLVFSCARTGKVVSGKKVLVLGMDGLDPFLLQKFMAQGLMPNFARLLAQGGDFKIMQTTIPAQSPVAWASFSTGANPGRTGIFDFIHREPKNFELYLSSSRTIEPTGGKIKVGSRIFSLKSAKVENLVGEKPFWDRLTDAGIPATIYRVPSDFPPFSGPARQLSGMGTPDLLGTYGTFSYYTDYPPENSKEITGGEVYPTFVKNNLAENFIYGPDNSFLLDPNKPYEIRGGERHYNYAKLKIPFKVFIDPLNPVAKIVVQDKEIFLKEGEWSDWVELKFELLPRLKHLPGMVKFYLKQVKPDFKLYVSPVNINPRDPALPIFSSEEYGRALVDKVGLFYTQGMAEDTKALTYGIFNDQEFWTQREMVTADWFRAYRWHLDNFQAGFLFFYFSTLDLGQHMFWRYHDPENPLHLKALQQGLVMPLEKLYQEMDTALGMAAAQLDEDTTLIVISDHGFAAFNRGFNLNSWLLDNGYLFLIDPAKRDETDYFDNVDWGRTRAYGLGINGLYLNLEGREGTGIVSPGQADQLLKELKAKLESVVDPKTREHPIKNAYIAGEVYKGRFVGALSPDIVLGYRRGFRASWETTLGKFPKEWIVDNTDPWSGDHCIDPTEVVATLVSNKKIKKSDPAIWDIGPSVLQELGVPVPEGLDGKPIF